jgi:UDPglucose--hexose-1-phosphate uridylyltransferase
LRLDEDPHRRFNPLTNEWIVVSPQRSERPWQGAIEQVPVEAAAPYDPSCYLCPGNARARGIRNPSYASTFVFDNDFAALKADVPNGRLDIGNKGLLIAEAEPGICRVMCFSPRHDVTLSTMPLSRIQEVIQTWTVQFRDLSEMSQVNHVQIFENRGAMMGASNPHPHCQIWATRSIPELPAKELRCQQNYLDRHKSCLLCDYIKLEDQQRVRIVCRDEYFVALVPFWAVWPFEILICSLRHLDSFLDLTPEETASFGKTLQKVTSTYDRLFGAPFPYSMGFHQCPTDDREYPEWHFHAHFYPPLLRSATVRKFMVGFEMLGTPQRDLTPEVAAEHLQLLSGQT